MTPGEDSGMRLLGLIDEHRDSLRAQLTDEQYGLLLTQLRALADAPPDDSRSVRRAFQAVRICLTSLPFGHPVREALDSVRLAGAASVGVPVAPRARDLLARLTVVPSLPPEPPETSAIIAAVKSRLRRAPAFPAAEVLARYRGTAPPPELIRFADPDHGDRYPEFQFEPGGGAPYRVVLEVNRVLLADADPWGAADWWLSGNAWLGGGPPAGLLGIRPDRDLVGAVVALVEGD
ncbi:hypothetical protein ABT354_27075 [Streptomyces sp. NPDC000594]|uniref:hypothetical protein n=1 Tax=Streptomyces sp. NPDC000594 TaxID=3154261 RepID=UPI0033263E9E